MSAAAQGDGGEAESRQIPTREGIKKLLNGPYAWTFRVILRFGGLRESSQLSLRAAFKTGFCFRLVKLSVRAPQRSRACKDRAEGKAAAEPPTPTPLLLPSPLWRPRAEIWDRAAAQHQPQA